MNDYFETLNTLNEEHANVRKMIHLRNSDPDIKIDLIYRMGARKAFDLCQQCFAYSDKDLSDHIKMIDQEVSELLMLVSPDEMGLGNILKSLE